VAFSRLREKVPEGQMRVIPKYSFDFLRRNIHMPLTCFIAAIIRMT